MKDIETLTAFLWLSRPLTQQVDAMIERGLTGTGLTVRMRAMLEILSRDGAMPVPDLARALEIKRQYVQVLVNETNTAGLTEKGVNPRHRASPLIALTSQGAALITRVQSQEAALVAKLAKRLRSADIDAALSVARLCHAMLRDINSEGDAQCGQ